MPPRAKKLTESKGLEATLWDAANALRSEMDSSEYKHVVLGLIFLKYVSDVFAVRQAELARLVDDTDSDYYMPSEAAKQSVLEDRDEYKSEGVFWVPEGHRWEDLRKTAKQPNIGGRVDAAMEAIERENPGLKGVLPKNFSRQELTPETLGGLIDIFSRQDLAAAEHEGLDVLGRVYEYFLGKFAANEGKNSGEFYTPRSIVALLVEMLQPYNGRVYDPACGSGGMFVQADKFVRAHNGVRNDISVFGQERSATTWRLAKMNLALRGIDANLGNEWGDTFHNDKHPDLRADFIMANPPFNISDWKGDLLRHDPLDRWKYGTPPVGNANFAWIQHMLARLAPTGTMATVLANGSLTSTQNGEDVIRKALAEADLVECVVALPDKLFYGTGIGVCLWFLTKTKSGSPRGPAHRNRAGEVLFIDARELGFMASRNVRKFNESDILRVADTYHAWRGSETRGDVTYEDVAGFCASVSRERIAERGYALAPGRYVGSQLTDDDVEPLDEKVARLVGAVSSGFQQRSDLQDRSRGFCRG